LIARTVAEAVGTYLQSFQQALACVTRTVPGIEARGRDPSLPLHRLALNDGVPALLPGPARVRLGVTEQYRIEPAEEGSGWRIRTVHYSYGIHDSDRREIVIYHWHPLGAVTHPHVHIGHGAVPTSLLMQAGLGIAANALRPDLARAHLPTGPVSIEDVLRLAIADFGVRPRRADWETVLRQTSAMRVGLRRDRRSALATRRAPRIGAGEMSTARARLPFAHICTGRSA
jgi:hypothetical protein